MEFRGDGRLGINNLNSKSIAGPLFALRVCEMRPSFSKVRKIELSRRWDDGLFDR